MSMNHPKAIMIDVDDTMVEWSETLSLAWRRACDRLADIVPGLDALLLEAMVVCNRKSAPELSQEDALSTALTNLGIATPPEMISVLDRFHQDRIDTVRPIRGAARAIRKIRTKVERLGVVTNGNDDVQRAKLRQLGVEDVFDVVVTSGETGHEKGEEEIYNIALQQLDVAARDAWMVGDSLDQDVALLRHWE